MGELSPESNEDPNHEDISEKNLNADHINNDSTENINVGSFGNESKH